MVVRIGSWIELSFWHLVVRVLSGMRPLGRGLSRAKNALADAPLTSFMPNGWVLALSGWLCGLMLGIALAIWWL
ncbi:MAG: hypothetical protein WD740_06625 [Anaerolineales bacterium]